ncbi:hypothetical protein [Salinigranum salinum]|uniref:hypothetical protein n=1 Tax=Salinigranum salinum TaxID=1364937 RepID=UPI001260CD42|nr:hypothetical protein [Salinigranum salinum]
MARSESTPITEALPPEKLLETDQTSLIRGGVACMHDIETVRQYVAHENKNDRRRWVLGMLAERAATLREGTNEEVDEG